jgi:hypothetical protein
VSVTGEASAIGCSQHGRVETGTKTELAKTSGKQQHEARRLRGLGAADDQGDEREAPAESEPEGGDEGLLIFLEDFQSLR